LFQLQNSSKYSGIEDSPSNSEVKKEILFSLQATHKILSSIVNRLMTPSLKPQNQSLRKKYEQILIKLLDEKDVK
jgi:hypothetical protein